MDNNNGKGIFYGVIGVATLVVAIIGATFAYFSATVNPANGSDSIQGETNGDFASSLTLTVNKLQFTGATASGKLVPADFGASFVPANITTTDINRALTAKCENAGYTGCHVWKITANASQAISNANINLTLNVDSGVTEKTQWSYVIYTGTDSAASAIVQDTSNANRAGSFASGLSSVDIHKNASLSANTDQVYYLMVYLNNIEDIQNSGTHDATGSYSGSVTMQAAGGTVKASFAA